MSSRKSANSSGKRICVVGAGRWGERHIRTLDALGCLGGVVEIDAAARARLVRDFPSTRIFADLSVSFAERYDGYIVATPAETHFEIAREIIEKGHHLLVEKPLALSLRDAVELKRLAETRGVNLMVGHVLLFHPAIRKIKELVAGGRIGKLQYIYSNRLNLGTVRTEENILWSFAPHDISVFQHLVGAAPEQVASSGGAFVQPHVHDSTITILRYPGNVVGHIFVSWLHPFKEHRLVVIGSKGMLSFEDSAAKAEVRFYEKGVDWIEGRPVSRDGPTQIVEHEGGQPLEAELRYFIDRTDGSPVDLCGADDGIAVLDILERATESLKGAARPPSSAKSGREYFAHPTAIVDENVSIGRGSRIWHFSHIQSGARIGEECSLGQNVFVGANVKIGDGVKIQNNVSVYEGVELEDHVFCGPSMVFTNVLDPRAKYPQRGAAHYRRTLVREGATLGANSTIVCGHEIGRHAFVAAGAVVACDVPDYALMTGVPAQRTGWVCECGERIAGRGGAVKCSRCDRAYKIDRGILSPAAAASRPAKKRKPRR